MKELFKVNVAILNGRKDIRKKKKIAYRKQWNLCPRRLYLEGEGPSDLTNNNCQKKNTIIL